MIIKVLEMFKVFKRTAFCILLRIPSPQPTNSSLTAHQWWCYVVCWCILDTAEPSPTSNDCTLLSSPRFSSAGCPSTGRASLQLPPLSSWSQWMAHLLCSASCDCAPHTLEHPRRPGLLGLIDWFRIYGWVPGGNPVYQFQIPQLLEKQDLESRIVSRQIHVLCESRAASQHMVETLGYFATHPARNIIVLRCFLLSSLYTALLV